jgi:hypothetical protein
MQMSGQGTTGASGSRPAAFGLAIDTGSIVTKISNTIEAQALPCGCVVGDRHGGLTFTDAVAAALESRSIAGWQEITCNKGEVWTIIILNR